jgi:hypothetical protein
MSFHIGYGDLVVGLGKAQVNDQRRAAHPVEGNVNGGFAVCLNVLGKVNMRAGVQNHLDLAGLPKAGAAMKTGQLEPGADRRRAEGVLANRNG